MQCAIEDEAALHDCHHIAGFCPYDLTKAPLSFRESRKDASFARVTFRAGLARIAILVRIAIFAGSSWADQGDDANG